MGHALGATRAGTTLKREFAIGCFGHCFSNVGTSDRLINAVAHSDGGSSHSIMVKAAMGGCSRRQPE